MALSIIVLTFLCVWPISAQILRKSIVPGEIMRGAEASVLCDADLAGLPDRVRGIHQMKLSWNRNRFRATFMLYKGIIDEYLRSRWKLKYYASAHRNIWGWIDRDDIKMEILITNANLIDTGEWCCEILYFHRTDDAEFSKRCQEVMVSGKAIVHPTHVSVHDNVQITCDGDLAGAPYTATELDYLMIVWENKEYDRNSFLLYEVAPDQKNDTHSYTHLLPPSKKSHWDFFKQEGRMRPNLRIDKNQLKIGIHIKNSKDHDTGFYCCGATYYDKMDVKRWQHRCQKLTVSYLSITPKKAAQGEEFRVFCHSDLAGVPAEVMGMERLEIFWEDSIHPMTLFFYSISEGPGEYSYIDKKLKSNWQFSSHGTTPLNQHGWFNRDGFRVELYVPSAGVYDAGQFCCEGAYYDLTRKLQVSTRCENMSVITKIDRDDNHRFSRNGSGFICTADYLVLVFMYSSFICGLIGLHLSCLIR